MLRRNLIRSITGGAVAALVAKREAAAQERVERAGKLGELGLTAQQVEAVLALSRDVVERVVWEVVPQLAEALIKEEITRLKSMLEEKERR